MNKMKKKVLMMTMAAVTLSAVAQQPVDYVNPIIGTNGMGHTFPGACTPFGWVQLSPDTDTIPHNVLLPERILLSILQFKSRLF